MTTMVENKALPTISPSGDGVTLTATQWGMISFLVSEVAFFSTLLVGYVAYLGTDGKPGGLGGPTPAEALSLPLVLVTTACLLSSSFTIHLAENNLHRKMQSRFILLWGTTILLGILFLLGTAYEWNDLIFNQGLTIGRNLFGTTFFTLVGFHALHVTGGLIAMLIILALALRGRVTFQNDSGVGMIAWYWHFVDGVWIVVFTVVYVVGR